jgi:dynein heavy chain, axonemal
LPKKEEDIVEPPEFGIYIRGLYIEGARWDMTTMGLGESRPKELFSEMPIIWLKPVVLRKAPIAGFYNCPVYKTLTRAGSDSVS